MGIIGGHLGDYLPVTSVFGRKPENVDMLYFIGNFTYSFMMFYLHTYAV